MDTGAVLFTEIHSTLQEYQWNEVYYYWIGYVREPKAQGCFNDKANKWGSVLIKKTTYRLTKQKPVFATRVIS